VIYCVEIYWNLQNLPIFQLSWHSRTISRTTCKETFRNIREHRQLGARYLWRRTTVTDNTVTLFTAGPVFLHVYTITTVPSFYFSDQEWRKLRKLVSPAFSSVTLAVYFDVFRNNAEILVQTLMTKVGAGEFDVCPYLNLFALDTIIGKYIKCHLRNFQVHPFCFTISQYFCIT